MKNKTQKCWPNSPNAIILHPCTCSHQLVTAKVHRKEL